MNSLLRRYREVVFVGVFLALPLLVYFARDQKRWLDRALMAFTAPVEKAIVVSVGGIIDAWGNYVWLRHTREDDFVLRKEMLQQRAELQLAAEITAENARLRGLLELADKSAPMKLLAAPVIAVGASPHSHTLRIGRGLSDGIKLGDAVISPDGIVGTITLATGGYADVQLIVAPQAAVPALSARTRGRSTVRGTGDLSRCHLDYALRTDELADGDILLTAGGAGFFPKGLKIGRVVDVQKRATGMFLGADVVPAVDFSRLDEVLVVLQAPSELAPPAGRSRAAPRPAPAAAALRRTGRLPVRRARVARAHPGQPQPPARRAPGPRPGHRRSAMTARNLLVIAVCFLAAILESTLPVLLPPALRSLRANLLLAVVLYLAFHDEWVQGAGLSFFTGCLSDLSAATPPGIYAFLAVLTFVIVRLTGSAFRADGGIQAAGVAFLASLVHALLATPDLQAALHRLHAHAPAQLAPERLRHRPLRHSHLRHPAPPRPEPAPRRRDAGARRPRPRALNSSREW